MSGPDSFEWERLKRIGERIGEARRRKSLTLLQLADLANLDEKTIRTAIVGDRIRPSSLAAICRVLEIEVEDGPIDIASQKFGAYNLNHYKDYIGSFYAYRRGFINSNSIVRSVYNFSWNSSRGEQRLVFEEFHKYRSNRPGKIVDSSQSGDVYISPSTNAVQLLTSVDGSLRLISLTKMQVGDNTMSGIVLTQAKHVVFHQPSTSAIFFQKAEREVAEKDLDFSVGPIFQRDSEYEGLNEILIDVEKTVGIFAISKENIDHSVGTGTHKDERSYLGSA